MHVRRLDDGEELNSRSGTLVAPRSSHGRTVRVVPLCTDEERNMRVMRRSMHVGTVVCWNASVNVRAKSNVRSTRHPEIKVTQKVAVY